MLETPEWALQVFERLTGLQIVVHDLGSELWPFLQPERFRHRSPCCMAVKARHDWACMDFEVTRLRQDILKSPEGRYHCCHAGFMEWVLPVFLEERLALILFAGQARASGSYQHLNLDIRHTPHASKRSPALPGMREDKAQEVLESLRQLGSRLVQWHRQASVFFKKQGKGGPGHPVQMADRSFLIERFLHQNHTGQASLGDLARSLKLGESRCSHLVKELFGASYVQLLNNMRLRTAASLLRESSLSVTEVCLNSGFRDLSHFHRAFHKRFATTPLKYRRMSHA
jgi:AraC-like DNA-binding protein